MNSPMDRTYPEWEFEDARGVLTKGVMYDFSDQGGTDVTYYFMDKQGYTHVVSGARLKRARVTGGTITTSHVAATRYRTR